LKGLVGQNTIIGGKIFVFIIWSKQNVMRKKLGGNIGRNDPCGYGPVFLNLLFFSILNFFVSVLGRFLILNSSFS